MGLLLAAACANDGSPARSFDGDTTTTEQAGAVDQLEAESDHLLVEFEEPQGEKRQYVVPAIGGLSFRADVSHGVYPFGDRVMVDPVGGFNSFDSGTAYIGLTTQDANGREIATVSDFVEALPGISVESTGQYIDLFGYRLNGYSTEPDGPNVRSSLARGLIASSRIGTESRHTWTPERDVLFLSETAAGVLYAGYDTGGSAENPVALGAFASLLASAELTGPGLDAALPHGSIPFADGPTPTPSAVVAGAPDPLQLAFADLVSGTYQLPNFGHQLSIELPGWRVQANQPGIVVITKGTSAGPGDDAVVLLAGLKPELVPLAGGPTVSGTPIDVSNIRAFLDGPPDGLAISNREEVMVAGLAAVRFDVRVDANQSCAQATPCEFAFQPTWPWNFVVAIHAGLEHRIWWFLEHPSGFAIIHASGPDAEFLTQASDIIATAAPVGDQAEN